MKVLHLTLEKKWFDMIASGKKREEYRAMKPYWHKRLLNKSYDAIRFRNGYQINAPNMLVELRELLSGLGIIEWGAPEKESVYILRLGKILDLHNVLADSPKGRMKTMSNETKKTIDDPLASERSTAPLGTRQACCSPHSKIGRIFEAEKALSQAIVEMCEHETELPTSAREKIGHAACLLSNYCVLNADAHCSTGAGTTEKDEL